MNRLTLTVATVLSLAFTTLTAQDYNKGLTAYKAGDYVSALQEWKPLAEQGNSSAQYKLGVMYKSGKGVPLDYITAVRWYHLAAVQGNAFAQSNLGFMYRFGKGVPQNFAQAYMWYELADTNGHKDAKKWLHNVSREMISTDIEKAQAMASECLTMSYNNCGW